SAPTRDPELQTVRKTLLEGGPHDAEKLTPPPLHPLDENVQIGGVLRDKLCHARSGTGGTLTPEGGRVDVVDRGQTLHMLKKRHLLVLEETTPVSKVRKENMGGGIVHGDEIAWLDLQLHGVHARRCPIKPDRHGR